MMNYSSQTIILSSYLDRIKKKGSNVELKTEFPEIFFEVGLLYKIN